MKKTLYIGLFLLFTFISLFSKHSNLKADNNILLEYCTGTWCGFCPCGHVLIEGILSNYPSAMVLAYHGAGNDPWSSYSEGIRGILGFTSYPLGCIGRISGNLSNSAWGQQFSTQSTIQPGVSIAVTNKSYDEGTRTFNATVKITANVTLNGDYYINYVLTENNIVYPQNFYASCGTPGYHNDYVHQHVVKSMMNGDLGELINSGTWNNGQEITRTVNYVVPVAPQVTNPQNCEVNIFVYKQGSSISTNSNVQQTMRTSLTKPSGIHNQNVIPDEFNLSQNYPNPFNPTTTISFSVPRNGNASLKFYDALGNEIASYLDGFLRAGTYSAVFEGANLSSGVYYYKFIADDFTDTKRMILMK